MGLLIILYQDNIIQDSIEIYSHSNSFQRLTSIPITTSVVPRTQSLQDGAPISKDPSSEIRSEDLGVMGTQPIPKKRLPVIFQVTKAVT